MYNEEENARIIIRSADNILRQVAADWEIIVVESGSKDHTRETVIEEARDNPKVVPLFQDKREGMGSALKLGYSKVSKELVWHIESDSPFDLNDIKKALVYFDKYDAVVGYRTSGNKSSESSSWAYSNMNYLENFIRGSFHIGFNLLIKVLFGKQFKDVNFSFKVFKAEFLRKISLSSNGWFIDAELLLELVKAGGRIKEIGIEYKRRELGKSTIRLGTPIKVFKEMLAYRAKRWNKSMKGLEK